MVTVFILKLPSGYVKIAIEHGPCISLIYLLRMVIFHSYVSLPEGNYWILNSFGWLLTGQPRTVFLGAARFGPMTTTTSACTSGTGLLQSAGGLGVFIHEVYILRISLGLLVDGD